MGRVRLEMRRLQQPAEVVGEQPPEGARTSDVSEARAGKRRRLTAAGKAVPSMEVRNESTHIEDASREASRHSHRGL